MPSVRLPIASKIREANCSSRALITVLVALTSIKALLGSWMCTISSLPDSASLMHRSTDPFTPIFDNTVSSFSTSGTPQCSNGFFLEAISDTLLPDSTWCLPWSMNSCPSSLVISTSSWSNFLQLNCVAKFDAISRSTLSFDLGTPNVSFSA